MSNYIMVVNKSAWKIHGALSWDAIQQQCFNDLNKDGNSHDFVVQLGWHDLTIVPGTDANRFDPAKDNKLSLLDIMKIAGSVVVLANPFTAPLALGLWAIPTDNGLFQLGTTPPAGSSLPSKQVKSIAGTINLSGVQIGFPGLYGPDGYTITVSGGEVDLEPDFAHGHGHFICKSVKPLQLSCCNRRTGEQSAYVGSAGVS